MNCIDCQFITKDIATTPRSKTQIWHKCGNSESDYYSALLNVSTRGDYLDYIPPMDCRFYVRSDNNDTD